MKNYEVTAQFNDEPCAVCGNLPSACDVIKKHRDMLIDAQSAVNYLLSTVVGNCQSKSENLSEPCSMMEDLALQSDLLCDVITKIQQLRSVLCG